jgi:hypothetical protein
VRSLLMLAIYGLVVVPAGVVRRLTGRSLGRAGEPRAETYWIPAIPPPARHLQGRG